MGRVKIPFLSFFSQEVKRVMISCLPVMAGIMMVNLTSCQNLDDVYGRLDKVEANVIDLQSAVNALQDAYSQGKIIKSVTPFTDAKAGGWLVTFSDGSSICLENGADGKDGNTPFLKIDQDDYWIVSYDNGQTFTRLLDNEDNPIKAVGQDGIDGEDGDEGRSIRLVINDAGYYVIQSYYPSDPTTVLNETVTPYTADSSCVIASITQDDKTHVITIELADGSTFAFNMHYVSPTSIVILSVNPIYLSTGTQASVEFRVNPSNALFKQSGDDCQIELDKVGTVQTRSSYVIAPSNYKLVRIEQVYDSNTEKMKVGQYRAIIEDTKKSAEYDEMVSLVLNVEDANGDRVQISSSAFEVKCINLENLMKVGLPVVMVNTPNSVPIVSKEEWIAGATVSIINSDMTFDYQGTANIKGRGNATWGDYPKKPYKLKLSDKHPVFGNPKSKKWQLLAEYCDKSFLRTAMMLELSKIANIRHTVSYDFVELYLNGQYNGLYILTEQVEKDKDRINIKDDGFIIEDDNYATEEPVWFTTAIKNRKYSFKYPDSDDAIVADDDNYNYIKGFMDDMEDALFSDNYQDATAGYRQYIDCESFAKWYIVMELLGNWDPNWYYVLDSRGSKLEMAPCWDAEWSLGLAETDSDGSWSREPGIPMAYNREVHRYSHYFTQLLSDPYFKSVVKAQWADIKTRVPQAVQNVQNVRNTIKNAANHNFTKWPILGTYPGVGLYTFDTWNEEADFIFTYFQQRLEWFDSYLDAQM